MNQDYDWNEIKERYVRCGSINRELSATKNVHLCEDCLIKTNIDGCGVVLDLNDNIVKDKWILFTKEEYVPQEEAHPFSWKVLLYGMVLLYLLSPFTIFMFLGYLANLTPSFVEVIGVLGGTGYYWQAVWIPVRQKCKVLDDEFMKRVFWR